MDSLKRMQVSSSSLTQKNQFYAAFCSIIGILGSYYILFFTGISWINFILLGISLILVTTGISFLTQVWWITSIKKHYLGGYNCLKLWALSIQYSLVAVLVIALIKASILNWFLIGVLIASMYWYTRWVSSWGIVQAPKSKPRL